jgi:hypothetical protein
MTQSAGVEQFIDQFFRLCKLSGLSFQRLQKIYIGKNCLNKFRQEHGYKEGTYIKAWNGIEDNVVMMQVLDELKDVTFDSLYASLEIKYSEL